MLSIRQCFKSVILLSFTTIFLLSNTASANTKPQTLRSDIKVRNVMYTLAASPSVRIAKDPRNNHLYYLKRNGEIYRVNLATSQSQLVYSRKDHQLSNTQGMAIGSDGAIYLVGNTNLTNSLTKATIVKGVVNSSTSDRFWSILAETAGYPKSNTAYDHGFNGIVVSSGNKYIYVNSGSRTDHGEIQSANGQFPNTREVGLTTCIFRLPTNGKNIFLPNNRQLLKSRGYVFAEGIRNTFDMAFAPNGHLFGAENGPDRDMPEELNWLRQGRHYGFPWRIGGANNPQQFPGYNPTQDRLLNPLFHAVKQGFYRNDPTFPKKPNITLTEPIPNFGPHADSFRDPQDGKVKDASNLGRYLSTFTAHRSPLGLVFDTQKALSSEFQGDGFLLSWTKGNPNGDSGRGPFRDPSEDLLHLKLTKVGNTNYRLNARRIVKSFQQPIDAEIIGNKIYVLEFGGSQGIWEITLPVKR